MGSNQKIDHKLTKHTVIIAGAGPTGLMLAGELALAGIDVAIIERRTNQTVDGSRAGGLHARSIEVLDQRGIVEPFLSEGQVMQIQGFVGIPLDISDFPSRHPYGLALWQKHIERLLAAWVEKLRVPIYRGKELLGFTQNEAGVTIDVSDEAQFHAEYLVGCDGGRSLVRKTAGIDFVGLEASTSWMIAEVQMAEQPQIGMRREGGGIGPVNRGEPGGPYRVVLVEREIDQAAEPTLEDLKKNLIAAYGTDFKVHSPTWISRFTDMTRQAAEYRRGRVLLAGDAAHVHPPQGGQGLNTGIQDAVNLGWKLALVAKKVCPSSLLDTYHSERHPIAARVLHNTRAQVALSTPDDRHQSLREIMMDLLRLDEPRKRIAGMLSGLDIHYDLGNGHPLLGRRMPDLELQSANGPVRVYTLLRQARPVFLQFGNHGEFDLTPWADRVQFIAVDYDGSWKLPVIGDIVAPKAVLVRPDGHVAWVGEGTFAGLQDALTLWFGAPENSAK